jgi:urease accessory protein
MMLRATSVQAKGTWNGDIADTIVLDFDERHRRRVVMRGVRGTEFLLDLPEAVMLRGGDALALEDGRVIEVVAAPEPLAEIRCKDPVLLVRVGWHLGNRHLPTQILGNKLRIRRDHVIEAMVRGLGANLVEIEAPFDPEGGAYAVGAADHHDHGHAHHDHDHSHGGHGHRHEYDEHKHHDHPHGHGRHEHDHHNDGHPHHDHHHDHGEHDHHHGDHRGR